MGYQPLLVDLDLDTNEIVPAGCIGAARIKLPLPNEDMADETVCMFHGYTSSNMIKKLYKTQVKKLSEVVNDKIRNKQEELNKEYADLVKNKQMAESIKNTLETYSACK